MRFTDHFVRRPVLSIVLSCLLLMLGIQAGVRLQIRQFPDVDKSLVVVRTAYPGASARTVDHGLAGDGIHGVDLKNAR